MSFCWQFLIINILASRYQNWPVMISGLLARWRVHLVFLAGPLIVLTKWLTIFDEICENDWPKIFLATTLYLQHVVLSSEVLKGWGQIHTSWRSEVRFSHLMLCPQSSEVKHRLPTFLSGTHNSVNQAVRKVIELISSN